MGNSVILQVIKKYFSNYNCFYVSKVTTTRSILNKTSDKNYKKKEKVQLDSVY
jgi:hypothetical protein